MREHRRTCSLCEALCGVVVEQDSDGTVKRIRGNKNDPLSRGHVCPKAMALKDLHEDEDRLRSPVMKIDGGWREIPWDMAIRRAGEVLHVMQEHYGRNAIGIYNGNPNAHHYSNLIGGVLLRQTIRTKNQYSATSVDQLPHHFAALHMFGHQLLLPVPDLERTDLLFIMGGNPMVSNGSIMTAPDFKHRMREIQRRDGRIVVIDPRRTETADNADEHVFIRPGTDTFMLLAMLQVIFEEDLALLGDWRRHIDGLKKLRKTVKLFTPERAETHSGVPADTIRRLAREFATTKRAAFYGRIGITTQEFGGLNAWLIYALNVVAGHFDTEGGVMFTSPAVDVVGLSSQLGQAGSFDRWRSRVSDQPEFGGELPVSTLAEEIETPGDGQIKAVVTIAGNPVLSIPNGDRLDRALEQVEFVLSIDPYINETTRHADIIIPPPSPLERDHFGLVFHGLAVRNTVKYSEPLFEPPKHVHDEWETMLALANRITECRDESRGVFQSAMLKIFEKKGPPAVLDLLLRSGPHGKLTSFFSDDGITLEKLRENPDGFDLGPLESKGHKVLQTRNGKLQLAPDILVDDLSRLEDAFAESGDTEPDKPYKLIGRRQLRSNNSWLHNSERMVRGKKRCTLLLHPDDAAQLGVKDGEDVEVRSAQGKLVISTEVSDEIMPGVVSIPHGWGHDKEDTHVQTAKANPGVSINDIVDAKLMDRLTGVASLNGIPVDISTVS